MLSLSGGPDGVSSSAGDAGIAASDADVASSTKDCAPARPGRAIAVRTTVARTNLASAFIGRSSLVGRGSGARCRRHIGGPRARCQDKISENLQREECRWEGGYEADAAAVSGTAGGST